MQIEKKLIACSILAIAIGIATIIPLQYLMNAQTATAMPKVEPWFNVDVSYADCNFNNTNENPAAEVPYVTLQAVANFTLTTQAMESDVDTQVEYYRFDISSENGPIGAMGYYIAESKTGKEDILAAQAGNFSGVGLDINGGVTFKNGITYNPPENNDRHLTSYCTSWSGQTISWTGDRPISSVYGNPFMWIGAKNDKILSPTITQLRDAQTLSIDVSKICTVTVKGNVVVTTPEAPTILQHIELTKTDSGFVYGTYTDDTFHYAIATVQP